jgi:hypothetical protein
MEKAITMEYESMRLDRLIKWRPWVTSCQRNRIMIEPGHHLKPWGGLVGLACKLESLMMESGDKFGKDTPITDIDGGGVYLIARTPGAIMDDLGTTMIVTVGDDDSDTNILLAPSPGGEDTMANDAADAIDLLAGDRHGRPKDEGDGS